MNALKHILVFFLFSSLLAWQAAEVNATTYQEVYQIFQSKCTGCHGGASPQGNLDLSLPEDALYDLLIEGESTNPFAQSKNYKLVDPGYPDRSFLYRKSNNGLYKESNLEASEGQTMPPTFTGVTLDKAETELIRQWILFGAEKDQHYINMSTLQEYYDDPSQHLERLSPPAPDPSEGFQLHLGTIFLEPNREVEYYYKYETFLPENIEVKEIEAVMNNFSHHFLFFKYNESSNPNSDPEGLERVSLFNADISEDLIGGWPYSRSYKLPKGTAYKWRENTVLRFNYHIKNYSNSQILPADVYVNVYTQPVGTAVKEMFSDFILYSQQLPCFIGGDFCIDPGEEATFKESIRASAFVENIPSNEKINIFMLGGHTHKYGTSYNIYSADNGVEIEKVYDGKFNYDTPGNYFDTGFFDYAEPPSIFFEPMLTVDANRGIVHEASYHNTGSVPVGFGLTTNDEMMGIFIQYTIGDLSGLPTNVEETTPLQSEWSVYPNPYTHSTTISYQLTERADVQLEIYDIVGKQVAQLVNDSQLAGSYTYVLQEEQVDLPAGLYITKLNINGKVYSKNLVKTD